MTFMAPAGLAHGARQHQPGLTLLALRYADRAVVAGVVAGRITMPINHDREVPAAKADIHTRLSPLLPGQRFPVLLHLSEVQQVHQAALGWAQAAQAAPIPASPLAPNLGSPAMGGWAEVAAFGILLTVLLAQAGPRQEVRQTRPEQRVAAAVVVRLVLLA